MAEVSEHDLGVSGSANNQPIGLTHGELPMPGATRHVFEFSRPLRLVAPPDAQLVPVWTHQPNSAADSSRITSSAVGDRLAIAGDGCEPREEQAVQRETAGGVSAVSRWGAMVVWLMALAAFGMGVWNSTCDFQREIAGQAASSSEPKATSTGSVATDRAIADRLIADQSIADRAIADRAIGDHSVAKQSAARQSSARQSIDAQATSEPATSDLTNSDLTNSGEPRSGQPRCGPPNVSQPAGLRFASTQPQGQNARPAADKQRARTGYRTRSIAELRTGERVLARNTQLQADPPTPSDIDPATWRNIRLRMHKADGGELAIVLLRPLNWLVERTASATSSLPSPETYAEAEHNHGAQHHGSFEAPNLRHSHGTNQGAEHRGAPTAPNLAQSHGKKQGAQHHGSPPLEGGAGGGELELAPAAATPSDAVAPDRFPNTTTKSPPSIHLDLPEIGASGPAEILAVEPCPPIESGPGQIITGTFAHSSASVIDLEVDGLDHPIGCTANHPFWSADRHDFVPVGTLRIGETLRTKSGTLLQVTRITPRRGPPVAVYNLEVDAEHVYFVSAVGALVHNSYGSTDGTRHAVSGKTPAHIGSQLESQAEIVKNTVRIPSLSGRRKYRVPDELTASAISEVKNVKYQHLSTQIQDYLHFALMTGRDFTLIIAKHTLLSPELEAAIRSGYIKLKVL